MKNQSKLFTDELARRNPDWEKIVAAWKDALATEQAKAQPLVEALERCRQAFVLLSDPQHANLIDDALKKYRKVSN
jgi:hypothetical protein